MMAETNTNEVPLSDWASPQQIAEEYPQYPIPTLRYMVKARERLGFSDAVRFLTPRRPLISRTRMSAWINQQVTGGPLWRKVGKSAGETAA